MRKRKQYLLIDQILLAQEEEKIMTKKKTQSKWFPQNDLYIVIAIVIVTGGLMILSKC